MRKIALILVALIGLSSCKSTRSTKIITKKDRVTHTEKQDLVSAIVQNALAYNGVRYRYGGTSRKGMDCSGLIYTAFKQENVPFPRISRGMARQGKAIKRSEVQKGDLLFFKTSKKSGRINHVGLVTEAKNGDIEFIHATTSRGVLTSLLSETYWRRAFVTARRVL